jgi:hypothetical protein
VTVHPNESKRRRFEKQKRDGLTPSVPVHSLCLLKSEKSYLSGVARLIKSGIYKFKNTQKKYIVLIICFKFFYFNLAIFKFFLGPDRNP